MLHFMRSFPRDPTPITWRRWLAPPLLPPMMGGKRGLPHGAGIVILPSSLESPQHKDPDMPSLASIHLYPIKSTAGMPLTRALVTEEGLLGDRRYMVVKPDGSFITARTHPQLQLVTATPVEGGLQLRYPGMAQLRL